MHSSHTVECKMESQNVTQTELDHSEVALPEGVDFENVNFDEDHPEFVAYQIKTNEWDEEYGVPFNPQNGRWYSDDPLFPFDSLHTVVGHECDCAYDDCDGWRTVEQRMDVPNMDCPECGEPKMGRAQFSRESKQRRSDQSSIRSEVDRRGDEFAREMQRLTEAGVGPTAAMDYLMCSVGDTSARAWADARDVKERTVKQNMKRVANALGETVRYNG